MAVKTFSIRFGSRRIQRPSHQKMRSSTTARATIETTRIGHIIGPPALKLRIKKFLSSSLSGVADGLDDPLGDGEVPTAGAVVVVVVAGDIVVVAGDIPGTVADAPAAGGAAGVMAGGGAGAAGGALAGGVARVGGGGGG